MRVPPVLLALRRNRRGVALPVALIGLVAVSILVTTVLLTGSTEFAISSAHRNGAASLFSADAALEQYVAQQAEVGGNNWMTPGETVIVGPDDKVYAVQVSRLSWEDNVNSPTATQLTAREVFSLLVQPQDGRGRAVGAFVNVGRNYTPVDIGLNAGMTSGGNVKVSGNAIVSDGGGANYCNADNNRADYAVQVSAGSSVDGGQQSDKRIEGEVNVADWSKDDMQEVLLNGATIAELAEAAEIKFGARWNLPEFGAENRTRADSKSDTPLKYNWGCPADILEKTACPTAASAQRLVSVAIDAGGGTVILNGDYGQGLLVVVNGNLRIQGNFVYKGIVMVEKDIFIYGGGGAEESKIQGAVVAFGAQSEVEDNVSGTATIRYNVCAIRDAARSLAKGGLQSADQIRAGGTFAWYELIR